MRLKANHLCALSEEKGMIMNMKNVEDNKTKEAIYNFTKEQMILRDFLAADRTLLANERTLLAYIRTGISLLIIAISLIKLFNGVLTNILGVIFIFLGIIPIFIGINRFRKINKKIKNAIYK